MRLTMVIRIKRKLYFKPRRCPSCNKLCLFVPWPSARHCKECSAAYRKETKKIKRKQRRAMGKWKYDSHYQRARKRAIKNHPYCALCGSEIRLTVHHVGGSSEHYTVLCDECHQAYERWNNRRKVKRCIQKIGIRRCIKNIKGALVGMSWRIKIKLIESRISNARLETLKTDWRRNNDTI